MEKLPKFFISTLIISIILPALNSVKTHALNVDSAGDTWWTISELLEYKSQIDEEEQVLCASNIACLQNYRQTKLAEEEKFNALTMLQAYQLMPTELDFESKTIKILLFDENMRARKLSQEPQKGVSINELAIWLGDKNDPTNDIVGNKIRKIVSNEVPEIYPIFGFTSDNPIELEKDEEIKYPMMMIDLENIKDHRPHYIRYSVSANYFNGSMTTGPASCLIKTNFSNGRCILNVSARDFRYVFEEVQEEAPSEEDENEGLTEPEEPTEPEQLTKLEELVSEPEPVPEEEPLKNKPTALTEDTLIETTTISNLTNLVNPKTPNTGSGLICQKTIEFPWWLIGLIALGDAAVLWLFWPKNRNPKKSHS